MPRSLRSADPDGVFHVMSHAVDGAMLFRRDADFKLYLALLALACERYDWTLFAATLMGNHVHLVVDGTTDRLSDGFWWMHWRYAEYYKRVYQPRFGHVFGGRPKPKPIGDDAYFLAAVRYVALNPVPVLSDRPETYRWSTHRAMLGLAPPLPMLARDRLLEWFGPTDPVREYERFVTGADPAEHRLVRRWAAGPPADRPPLEELVASRTGAAYLAAHETWEYSLRAIAEVVGISHTEVRRAIASARPT